MKNILTQEYIQSLFHYDPKTGIVTNRARRGRRGVVGIEAGSVSTDGRGKRYRSIEIDGKCYGTHRIIWLYIHGSWPDEQIDHVDGNGLNNRLENLREVSNSENQRNARLSKSNTSGVTGVSWNKPTRKWITYIRANGQRVHLGLFTRLEDAIEVRRAAEIEQGYHPNHGQARTVCSEDA